MRYALLSFSVHYFSGSLQLTEAASLQMQMQYSGLAMRELRDSISEFSTTNADAILTASLLMSWQARNWYVFIQNIVYLHYADEWTGATGLYFAQDFKWCVGIIILSSVLTDPACRSSPPSSQETISQAFSNALRVATPRPISTRLVDRHWKRVSFLVPSKLFKDYIWHYMITS